MNRETFIKFCMDNYGFTPNDYDLQTFDMFAQIYSEFQTEPSEKTVRSLIESNNMHRRHIAPAPVSEKKHSKKKK